MAPKKSLPWGSAEFYSAAVREIRGGDSQEAFARTLGVRIATLSRWENKHCVPSPIMRQALESLAHERKVRLCRGSKRRIG